MKSSHDKLNLHLKIYYIATIIVSIITFILTVAYTEKYNIYSQNIVLERYAIIITLIGIPLSLRLFYSKTKALKQEDDSTYKRIYKSQYIIRLATLTAICFFNIISLYITGSKNFYFMVIITIFAYLLCAPQKIQIKEVNDDNHDVN